MKIFGVTFVSFLFTPSESRISVNFGNNESTTIAGDVKSIDMEETSCCEMIESHVFGTKRSYRMQERNGQIEWVSNDSHLIKFNNLLQMWQVVNATTSNQIGEAFTHGGDAAAGCPTDTDWTVKNVNSWVAVKNFARCQGENEDEENAYRLSYSVCDIIKSIDTASDNERVRSSLQKRKNTLCNRAMNHARRVMRQKKCTPEDTFNMRSMKTFYAVDTVQQWRDQLQRINEERNANCENKRGMKLLSDALDRFYESTTRLFLRQNW